MSEPGTAVSTHPRRVLFLTGTRADFGKMKPLMHRVDSAGNMEAHIFATGMHMLARYGSTVNEIYKTGLRNVHCYINQDASVTSQMDMVLAHTIQGLGHYVREFPPDLLVVHGDRVETLAGAIVGALNNVLVAHVEGGEVSGAVDESIRHAVTKLAHLHFVSNDVARRRLIQMGEDPSAIFVIGSPDIDVMLSDDLPSLDEVKARYDIAFDNYALLLYHPVTTGLDGLRQRAREVMAAVVRSGERFVALYPNNDTGSAVVLEEMQAALRGSEHRLLPSMRFEHYLTLLKHARFILGNSSSGIHEAPVFGVPTINVGSRQRNRFDHESITNVDEVESSVLAAIRERRLRFEPTTFFGDGRSAERFAATLSLEELWQRSRQKQFMDAGAEAIGYGVAALRSAANAGQSQ